MRSTLLIRLSILVVLLVVIVAGGNVALRRYLASPLALPAAGYHLDIPAGTTWAAVTRQLAGDGIVKAAPVLRLYGRWSGDAGRIQAGEYLLQPGLTPRTLLRELVEGRVLLHRWTLVEGWTVREILRTLAADAAVAHTLGSIDTITATLEQARALSSALGLPWPSAEGAFLPETYRFPRGTTDRALLLRAHAALMVELDKAWAGRAPDLPLADPYQLLILASIIERETGLASERAQIAGVFIRRLKLGMRLQTDPTVIYGLGDRFDGNLTRRHLETDAAWNTYTRAGLPPTPIAAPGAESIAAAAHPADGKALFFVATGNGDGSHHFSDTLGEHEAAVRAYLANLRNHRDR
ncbi:MAG: endolytic transglycosylase MltG [Gammaproteobacteria bacterium PRO9]|nr:endolytic transglycosylase MltG [Gammaproteobacteria bacterium PRO9]